MKKAIVTGATGFVGRHLTEYLCEREVEVYTVFRDEAKSGLLPNRAICVCDDLSDHEKLIKKLSNAGAEGADAFYHLAWNGVQANQKNDYDIQVTNIAYGKNALDTAYGLGCKKFINTGATSEYVASKGMISDRERPSTDNIYGAFKIAAQYILPACAERCGQAFINTILTSTYGEHRTDDNILSYTIKSLLKGDRTSYGRLDQPWDFIYVKDAVRAFYLIGEHGINGKTYAIGTGEQKPLYEYIHTVGKLIDPNAHIGIGEKGDAYSKVFGSCVDISELRQDTGFEPLYSFENGIIRTIEWFRKECGII